LRDLATSLEKEFPIDTRVVAADLSHDDFLPPIREPVQGLEVGLLVNNAGFSNTGDLLDNDLDAELAMLHVNCRAPLMLAHDLGKPMRERGKGGIIFVSSIVAFAGAPAWSNYCATKAYDLILAEGLAWIYRHPTVECAKIQGLVSFLNEKVDIYEDDELLPRPKTIWS
jgi:short-subunit dehydrogenase